MRRSVVLLAALLLVSVLMAGAVSADTVTEIKTTEDLVNLSVSVNAGEDYAGKTVTLVNSITVNSESWIAIGNTSSHPFKGIFQGGNHQISYTYTTTEWDNRGNSLFGYVENATFSNIQINAATMGIRAPFVYKSFNSTFTAVSSYGTVSNSVISNDGESLCAAGIIGYALDGTALTDCTSSASISLKSNTEGKMVIVGGLVNQAGSDKYYTSVAWPHSEKYAAEFNKCSFTGTVSVDFNNNQPKKFWAGSIIGASCYPEGSTDIYFAIKITDCTPNTDFLTITGTSDATPIASSYYSYYDKGAAHVGSGNTANEFGSKGGSGKHMAETVPFGRISGNVYVDYTSGNVHKISYGYWDSASQKQNYGQGTWDGELVPGINFWYGADTASDSATKVVAWTGDAINGYTLAISESGSYKLMESFKYADYDSDTRLTLDSIEVRLDLNGKKITAQKKNDADDNVAFVMIKDEGSLTVTGNGAIDLTGPYMFYAASESSLTIQSGTFTANGGTVAAGNGVNTGTKMIISGGKLTSTGAPAVFMPSTQTLIINGTADLTGPVGVDIKTGSVTINENAKITATGNGAGAIAESGNGPVEGESSAIVLERTNKYKGDLVLTIGDNAQISSEKGAAIRNYIRSEDLINDHTYKTPVITVQDNAKLSGTVTLENRKYTDPQTDAVVGTFNLNAGYYKFTDVSGTLLKGVTPTYPEGYAMSTEPVNDGYYAPVKATKPEVAESVTPKEDGTVEIDPIPSGSLSVEGKTVTLTAAGTSGDDNSVILKITYDAAASVSSSGASGNVASVLAEYKAISLENAPEVTAPTVDMTIELNMVDTNLPNITGKLGDAKQSAVQTFGGKYTTFKMGPAFVASHEKLTEFNINVSSITLTFLVPKSWAPLSGNIGVVHISDGSNPAATTNGIQVVVTDAGDSTNWKVTATSSKGFSGYATYYGVSSTPVPPVPPVYSSGDGNMDGAYRVLFETNGGSFISPATGLSAGDKITLPAAPTKEGSSFVGWYKDAACTQGWSFSETIDGDMTLYAKWSGGSSGQTASATIVATAKQTTKATTAPAATTSQSQASATTAAGVSPTLTQAPAPVFGALLGLLAAGVLLRRRD